MQRIIFNLIKLAKKLDQAQYYSYADTMDRLWMRMALRLGEYWFTPDQVLYADGDYGDVNHDMLAAEEILDRLGWDLSREYYGIYSLSQANDEVQEALRDGTLPEEFIEQLKQEYGEDYEVEADAEAYIKYCAPQNGLTEAQINELLNGLHDSRKYAMQHFEWIRFDGKNIETWTLNANVVHRIVTGLEYAANEGRVEENDYDLTQSKFNIYVYDTGKFFEDVSYTELASGHFLSLLREQAVPAVKRRQVEPGSYYKYVGG